MKNLNETTETKAKTRTKLRSTEIDPTTAHFKITFLAEDRSLEGSLDDIPPQSRVVLLWYGVKQFLADNGKNFAGAEKIWDSVVNDELRLTKQHKSDSGLEAKLMKAASQGSIMVDMEALKKLLAVAKTL